MGRTDNFSKDYIGNGCGLGAGLRNRGGTERQGLFIGQVGENYRQGLGEGAIGTALTFKLV